MCWYYYYYYYRVWLARRTNLLLFIYQLSQYLLLSQFLTEFQQLQITSSQEQTNGC
jgi:hypothetical protein